MGNRSSGDSMRKPRGRNLRGQLCRQGGGAGIQQRIESDRPGLMAEYLQREVLAGSRKGDGVGAAKTGNQSKATSLPGREENLEHQPVKYLINE